MLYIKHLNEMDKCFSDMQEVQKACEQGMQQHKDGRSEEAVPCFIKAIQLLTATVEHLGEECNSPCKDCELRHQTTSVNLKDEGAIRVQAVIERCITGTEGFGSLESVVGFQKPKEDIIASLVLPIEVPSAFSSGIRHNNMFLLYGLPGMGKTKFAGAIAKYVHGKRGCTFFNVSASELLSTWHSESEKALLTLFSRAEQETCSIIFLDEIDELISKREAKDTETSGRLKSIFLRGTEGLYGTLQRTTIIAATNRPWVIDEGAWSRFQKKYYIPFPSLEQRKEIFLAELQLTPNVVTSGDLERISTWTSGYSGRDIKSLMRECWTGHVQKYKDDFVQGKVVPLELVEIRKKIEVFQKSVKMEDIARMNNFISTAGYHGCQDQSEKRGQRLLRFGF